MKRYFLLVALAMMFVASDAVAQRYEECVVRAIESIELPTFDCIAPAEEKEHHQKGNVYDYPTKNGIYNGYLYTSNPLKGEPLKIEYGSNFLFSMSTKDYNRFYAGFSAPYISWKEPADGHSESYPFTQGYHIGYLHASHLSKKIPLFLEYGVNFQYFFGRGASRQYKGGGSNSYFWETNWATMYSLNVPLNLALRLGYQGGEKIVTPYLGVNLRYNVDGAVKQRKGMANSSVSIEEIDKVALFDKTENDRYAMGEKAFNRFQVGVNFGVGYTYKKFYVGVGCVVDAMRIINAVKESKYSWQEHYHIVGRLCTVNISVGVQF